MQSRGKDARALVALVIACLVSLSACGGGDPPPADPPPPPTEALPPGVYDPARLDVDRPCTFLTEADAARLSGMPYYRTLSTNKIDEGHVRCSRAVGEFGLQSVLSVDVLYPLEEEDAPQAFAAECRALGPPDPETLFQPHEGASAETPREDAPANEEPEEGEAPAQAPSEDAGPPPPPPRSDLSSALGVPYCRQSGGGLVLRAAGHVVRVQVRGGAGETDPQGTARLAQLVAERLAGH